MFGFDKPKKNDSPLCSYFFGVQEKRLYHAWLNVYGATAYVFRYGNVFCARGKKEEKAFAEGFFCGWKRALVEAGDNPWCSADSLPEGPTRKVMLWADIGNGFEVMFGHWASVQQEFTVNLTSNGLVVKYWKEIVEPE